MARAWIIGIWRRFYNDRPLFWSVTLVASWRLLLEAVNQVAVHWITPAGSSTLWLHLDRWVRWDGGWYMDIIRSGYRHIARGDGQENFAFFPSFPVTTDAVAGALHMNPVYVGLFLNTLLTVGTAYLLYRITELLFDRYRLNKVTKIKKEYVATVAVAILLVFPSSFFFAAFYSESFLVLGVTGAVYFALKGRLWLSALFAALATASKTMGLVALPTVAVIVLEDWWRHKEAWTMLVKRWAIVACGTLGIVGYMLFQWIQFGDPLLFYRVEEHWGRTGTGFFIKSLYERWYMHITDPSYYGGKYGYALSVMNMALPFLMLGFGVWIWRRFKAWWPLVLGLCTLLLPLQTGVLDGLNRYLLAAAPLAAFASFGLAQYVPKWRITLPLLVSVMLVTCGFAAGYTIAGYFAG